MSIWSTALWLEKLHEVDWPGQTERVEGSFVDVATTAAPAPGWLRLSVGGQVNRSAGSITEVEVMLDPDETRQLYLLLGRLLGV